MESLCTFSTILWNFDILWMLTDRGWGPGLDTALTTHNIWRILFIFDTSIDLSMSMRPNDYEVSMLIF